MTTQAGYWTAAGGAFALAVVAGIFEWLRARRRNLDDPGWVPWRGIQVAGFFAALILAVMATNA